MKLSPEHRRLLDLAEAEDTAHLGEARAAVLAQFGAVDLKRAEKALAAALKLPASRRPEALRGVMALLQEAARQTKAPPRAVLAVMRRMVRDRVLNAADLAVLTRPDLALPDTRELEAESVARQRAEMRKYWAKESQHFKNTVAVSIREAIRKGMPPEQTADLLQERLSVSRSRAVLIAQDQLLTASSTAERRVLQSAGAKQFQWWSLMDGRQRKSHELLHGKVFTWRSAPTLPGAEIRCRCRAILPSGT